MKHYCLIQAAVPDYRIGFLKALNTLAPLKIVFGDKYFTKSVVSDERARDIGVAIEAKNKYLLSRKVLMQIWPGMWKDLWSNQVRIVELNPRCVISWLSLLYSCVLRRGDTALWGHRLNHVGSDPMLSVRKLMIAMSSGVIFYTKGQKESFTKTKLGRIIPSGFAPNSVLNENQVSNFTKSGKDFIYVGRLVEEKKPLLLIKAFIVAKEKSGEGFDSVLHVVGAGPCFNEARSLIDKCDANKFIILHGHQSNYDFLKDLYSRCVASVSPGYVGLSITQSFSFGKPMVISKDEPHSPELECFKEGVNGTFYESDSVDKLAEELVSYYNERDCWFLKSKNISSDIKNNYTYEAMAKGFYHLVEEVQNGKL